MLRVRYERLTNGEVKFTLLERERKDEFSLDSHWHFYDTMEPGYSWNNNAAAYMGDWVKNRAEAIAKFNKRKNVVDTRPMTGVLI